MKGTRKEKTGREKRGNGIEGKDGYPLVSERINATVAMQLHSVKCAWRL